LKHLENQGKFTGPLFTKLAESNRKVFQTNILNDFMELTRPHWQEVRATVQQLFSLENSSLLKNGDAFDHKNDVFGALLTPISEATMVLPCRIGDYTDFYSSKNHACNIGSIFRDPSNPLMPNYTWLPVGYHGRSSSCFVSGTNIPRPMGQIKGPKDAEPAFKACNKMDFELEIAAYYGGPTNGLGNILPITEAENHVFGFGLMNDWSARDIQVWEYVPLGPFTAKNLGTILAPWIITLDALEPFRCKLAAQDPPPMPYLTDPNYSSWDVPLEIWLKTESSGKEMKIATSNYKYMYWTVTQQLTHHTVTGCNMVAGDCLGSGTISGTTPEEYGSLMELSWNGTKPLKLESGEERSF